MTLRAAVKQTIGRFAISPPVAARTRSSLIRRVNVVYHHYIGDRCPYYDDFYYESTLERLDADLAVLGRHFEFCSLEEVLDGPADASGGLPRLAVTFDDGFDLIRSGVLNVLVQHGVRATTFVVTSTLDNADLMWRNKMSAIRALRDPSVYVSKYNEMMRRCDLPEISQARAFMLASEAWPMDHMVELSDELWRSCDMPPLAEFLDEWRPYFTWEGLRAWLAAGHHVGLHTATHPYCNRIGPAAVTQEIIQPAALLRRALGLDFLPFSYPFGIRLSEPSERELYELGVFDCAFGIEGFARRGTVPHRLERASIEKELYFPVFGRAFLGLPRS
jgi:peptidoglycan/xylan/chitin deacetylase (PgdA/CDA1 family)